MIGTLDGPRRYRAEVVRLVSGDTPILSRWIELPSGAPRVLAGKRVGIDIERDVELSRKGSSDVRSDADELEDDRSARVHAPVRAEMSSVTIDGHQPRDEGGVILAGPRGPPRAGSGQPLRPVTRTPSTIRRLATRNTISRGSAESVAPAMMGPYDSEL
jgi:hypothetical protein